MISKRRRAINRATPDPDRIGVRKAEQRAVAEGAAHYKGEHADRHRHPVRTPPDEQHPGQAASQRDSGDVSITSYTVALGEVRWRRQRRELNDAANHGRESTL